MMQADAILQQTKSLQPFNDLKYSGYYYGSLWLKMGMPDDI